MNRTKLAGLAAAQGNCNNLPLGTVVGAHRWPYSSAHPDCWQAPCKGVVIALNDRRIWKGNASLKTQEDIDRHVVWCHSHRLFAHDVAVLWEFGEEQTVYISSTLGSHRVRPYAEDYLEWQAARAAEYDRERARRDLARA